MVDSTKIVLIVFPLPVVQLAVVEDRRVDGDATGTFSFTASLNVERDQGAIVLLPDGVVLVAGGNLLRYGKPYFRNCAELHH